jgi:hypothetical protein
MSIIYHGNNANWINQQYLNTILDTPGDLRPAPRDEDQTEEWKKNQFDNWYSLGYDMSGAGWSMYYHTNFGLNAVTDMPLPIKLTGNTIEWWYVKINPCKTFPMHFDAFKAEAKNFRRFWIPMQNYIPGHIFIYEDKLLDNYKAGDIFEFTNPQAWHGAGNISTTPKVSFQLVCYDL